jgi:hypothetical protein
VTLLLLVVYYKKKASVRLNTALSRLSAHNPGSFFLSRARALKIALLRRAMALSMQNALCADAENELLESGISF